MKSITRFSLILALAIGTTATAQAEDNGIVEIGTFNWSDALFTSHVAQHIIRDKMGHEVEMTKADPAAVYQGVAGGDLDFHTDAWLPDTHADYYQTVAQDTVELGPVYSRARLGWIVPSYVPEDQLNSIEDLKSEEVMERLDGKIVGINPGAGMTAALRRAIDKDEWVVVTGWSPHWKFGRWDLRYIDDPKGVLGTIERADIIARTGFYREFPDVYEMLDRMTIPLDDVQAGMDVGERKDYETAARQYVENHSDLVDFWITGELPK